MPKPTAAPKALYRGVDLNAMAEYTVPASGKFTGWLKIPDSSMGVPVPLRLLPPIGNMADSKGRPMPWVEHHLHYMGRGGFLMPDGQKRAITCLEGHGQGTCPVCTLIDWLSAHDQQVIADDLALKVQFLTQVINRDDDKMYKYQAPASLIKKWKNLFDNKKYGDFTNPLNGRDTDITKTGMPGQWMTIRYEMTPDASPSPIDHEGWETEAIDLTTLIVILKVDEIKAILGLNLGKMVPLDRVWNPVKKGKKIV